MKLYSNISKKLIMSLAIFSLVLGLSKPQSTFADTTLELIDSELSSDAEKIMNDPILVEMMTYIKTDDTGILYFDTEMAIKSGASEQVLVDGKIFNRFSNDYENYENAPGSETIVMARLKLPVWGNWCGPGHGGGATKDLLDAACKQHDLDYGKYGYFDCGSDFRLIARISRDYDRMKFFEKSMARSVVAYFYAQLSFNQCY
ncbi:hypothetical protein [Sutcliffiella horikoshii]|uniref:hypothetical protein n=1 Tax=Sutcliffiella horikoshii TaxID=79883 RepID=UPI003CF5080A